MKTQPTEWANVFANPISDKRLTPRIYKELLQPHRKTPFTKGQKTTPGCLSKGIESRESNRYLHTSFLSSILHNIQNNQQVEAAQVAINRWMYMPYVRTYVHTCIRTYVSSHKKEWNSNAFLNLDEPLKHYAKWNRPNTKGHIWLYLYETPRRGRK